MQIGNFNTSQEVLVVAEIGNNHEGSYALAEEMIGLAAEAGAGAVKFQTIVPERLVSSTEHARIAQLRKFQLSPQQFSDLSVFAKKCGILFLSTPFDVESVEMLNPLVPAFKIASSDNTFYPLIDAICKTGKPLIISSGLAGFDEIATTAAHIKECYKKLHMQRDFAVLHCVSSYPTKPEDANLLSIKFLKDNLKCTIGYSDHTLGIEAAVASVSLGAEIIEKHFTKDKNYSDFRDHQLSATPKEMKELTERVKQVRPMLGSYAKPVSESEQNMIAALRRSIAANKDLQVNHTINPDDLTWLRPGKGLPVGKETFLIGKKLKKSIGKGEFIFLEDIH